MTDTTPIATTENRLAAREAITAARAAVERLREDQPNSADIITTALDWAVVMTDQASLLDQTPTEIEKLRAQLTDVRRVVIQWREDAIDGNSAMTSIERIVPAADPAADPQGIEQLRAHLANAAGIIRYLADDARGILDPNDPGNTRGRIHSRHAEALERILEGEDDGLRERALKEAGTWSFQSRWKDGDTRPEDAAQAAAYRDDLALLNDALRATRSEDR